jgi:hypothetical protein
VVGPRNGRAIEGGGGVGINFQLSRLKDGKDGEGRRAGAAGVPVGAGRAEVRKGRREEGEGGADKWGRRVGGTEEKKKEAGRWAAAGREMGRWASRAEKKVRFSFPFFSF